MVKSEPDIEKLFMVPKCPLSYQRYRESGNVPDNAQVKVNIENKARDLMMILSKSHNVMCIG